MFTLVKLRSQRGQTSIFMALLITTMMLLFAFTTNIGMLVHAKINLQNAADAAAYAGAAVQARQLTNVAYLNWEMRRALKNFLFYYDIRTQQESLGCFPQNVNGGRRSPLCSKFPGDADIAYNYWIADPREINNEGGSDKLPTVCMIFSDDNNYCQKYMVPGIPEFQGSGSFGVADPIVAAVSAATDEIIRRKINDCLGRTEINQKFLLSWLFNVRPLKSPLDIISTGRDAKDPFPFDSGIDRLGYFPRYALLRARIDNYEEALNMNLINEGLGTATIEEQSLEFFQNVPAEKRWYFERPIQAFLSARNNLPYVDSGNGIFRNIRLSELLPGSSGGIRKSPGLENEPILAKFEDTIETTTVANSIFFTRPNATLRGECNQNRELRTFNGFPYGVHKNPAIMTYYAVNLQADARLLFSPFGKDGTVTLSAYSAAKPFGSRVGKNLNLNKDNYIHKVGNRGEDFTGATIGAIKFPNVPITYEPGESSKVNGFVRNGHLGYIAGAMSSMSINAGVRLAGAYAPWEVGNFTPPANFSSPDNIGLFLENPEFSNSGYFLMEAPVAPVKSNAGRNLEFLKFKINNIMENDPTNTTLDPTSKFRALLDALMTNEAMGKLYEYLDSLNYSNYHAIPDPMLNDDPLLLKYAKAFGARYTVAALPNAQKYQLTSWNNQKTAVDGADAGVPESSELGLDFGRSGYSVRFVSFPALGMGGRGTNDPEENDVEWSNPLARITAGDAAARLQDDLSKIKH